VAHARTARAVDDATMPDSRLGAVAAREQHRLDTAKRTVDRVRVVEITDGHVDARLIGRSGRLPYQGSHVNARSRERTNAHRADLPGRAGDENRGYASAAFLGSLLPPSELFFSDLSDDFESLELSDLPSDAAFDLRP
jgi:hypothetical protein